MPQLRWTLLFLGVLFIILLAWIERRRQRRQGFTDSATVEKDHGSSGSGAEGSPGSMFREPALALPEMRAAREPTPPHELPVVEIEEDSLNARRLEVGEPLLDPPTLSLPVVGSGPEIARRRGVEPTVSDFDSLQLTRTDEFAKVGDFQVPRLDTPASKADARTSKLDTPGANSDPAPGLGAAAHSKPTQAPKPPANRSAAEGIPRGASGATRDNRINLADTYVGGDSAERAFNQAVFGDSSVSAADADEPHTRTDVLSEAGPTFNAQTDARTQFLGGAAAPVPAPPAPASSPAPDAPPAVPRFTASDVTPVADPIVEWPPDDQRRVIAVRLVASPSERFAGRALRLALASEGFVLGKFQIFHKPDDNGRAVLSAANLSKPGTFDTATMDSQRYGGLSLFIVLPGPRPSLKAFEDLLATARNLNERLQGALQDERGGPLTPTRIASLRDSLAPGSAGVESETPS